MGRVFCLGFWLAVLPWGGGYTLAQIPVQTPVNPNLLIPEAIQGTLTAPQANAGKNKSNGAPDKQVLQPDVSIPSGPLGFAPPAPYYIGSRIAQVSLNFLDEDHLLFTFRVPGLISRVHASSAQTPGDEPSVDKEHNERHIRAVVLALPNGKVTAEALWRLHDNAPYLYPLKNQKFLLRDRNTVKIGDAGLHLDLFLRFPGTVRNLEMGPDQSLLVANTSEPPAPKKADVETRAKSSLYQPSSQGSQPETSQTVAPESSNASSSDSSPSSSSSSSSQANDDQVEAADQDLLRILRMDDRAVMLFSRVEGIRHVPIDAEGFYEALRGSGTSWQISFQDFHGSSTPLEPIESTCSPALDVMAPGIVLASSCPVGGGRQIAAITRDKRLLWSFVVPPTRVWALLMHSENGQRIARETLDVTHAVGPNYPLDVEDIRAQTVQVYELGTGKIDLTVPASPILDGGGNFALSPSGNKLAVLNAGAIQIYNLPPIAAATAAKPQLQTTH